MGQGDRIPAEDRYVGRCENCGAHMWMSAHGWSNMRRSPRRWCTRECRNEGNRRERKERGE